MQDIKDIIRQLRSVTVQDAISQLGLERPTRAQLLRAAGYLLYGVVVFAAVIYYQYNKR